MGSGVAVVQDRALEAEADRLGQRAASHRIELQAKLAPGAVQPSPVRISAPISAGPGSYRLNAGTGGRQVGSVMVHARDRASVEVTDLGVDLAHREHGIGKMLVESAARTGLQFGKSKVTLAAQDNGSGHLKQWQAYGLYAGRRHPARLPRLEAPISRLVAGSAQRKVAWSSLAPFRRWNSAASPTSTGQSKIVPRRSSRVLLSQEFTLKQKEISRQDHIARELDKLLLPGQLLEGGIDRSRESRVDGTGRRHKLETTH